MTEFSKFTYQHLDVTSSMAPAPARKRAYTDTQIEEIRIEAFNEGKIAGEQSALSRIEMRSSETLHHIVSQISDLHSDINKKIAMVRAQSAELALTISKNLTPALIAREPLVEIEHLFASCVAHLKAEPRIVIRLEEALVAMLKDKIDGIAHKAGYPGKIVLLGDPDALPAQCQIEWSDGGVTHRSPGQQAIIDNMISAYFTENDNSPHTLLSSEIAVSN